MAILGKEYSHFNVGDSVLDSQFVRMVQAVESDYGRSLKSRQERLRCEAWIKKLAGLLCCDKVPLLKNRNNYLKQL